MTASYYTGAQVRALTGFSARQINVRIATDKFPKSVDRDRWRKSEVDAHLAGAPVVAQDDESPWTVDQVAIERAVARFVRRAAESAAAGRGRRDVAHPARGSRAPPALRLASNNVAPAR